MTRRTKLTPLAFALPCAALTILSSGCTDDLERGTQIVKTRVLGARVEVQGDETNAWPAPGQATRVTFSLAEPGQPRALTWAFGVCVGQSLANGASTCAGAPFHTQQGTASPPVLDFTVPDAATLGDATKLLVFGAVCAGGELDLSTFSPMQLPACRGENPNPTNLTFDVRLSDGTTANHNPTIAPSALTFAGAAWPMPADFASIPLTGCGDMPESAEIPHVSKGSDDRDIGIVFTDADREPFTRRIGDPPMDVATREALQMSHFATAGRLDRQFTVIDADDTRAVLDEKLPWTPPEGDDVVDAHGTLVRFFFVLRDLRGGFAATQRVACVVP